MVEENEADRISADLRSDLPACRFLGHQSYGPPRAAFRRWTAYHRDQRSLLRAVELGLSTRTRIVTKRVVQATTEVSFRHPGDFTAMRLQRIRSPRDGLAGIEQPQHVHSFPDTRREALSAASPTTQLSPIRC